MKIRNILAESKSYDTLAHNFSVAGPWNSGQSVVSNGVSGARVSFVFLSLLNDITDCNIVSLTENQCRPKKCNESLVAIS